MHHILSCPCFGWTTGLTTHWLAWFNLEIHYIPSQRQGVDAVYIPCWRSTPRGSTTCHLMGETFLYTNCTVLSSGVEIIFTFGNLNLHQYPILDGLFYFVGGSIHNANLWEGLKPFALPLVWWLSGLRCWQQFLGYLWCDSH